MSTATSCGLSAKPNSKPSSPRRAASAQIVLRRVQLERAHLRHALRDIGRAQTVEMARRRSELALGPAPPMLDDEREQLGRVVREVWVDYARGKRCSRCGGSGSTYEQAACALCPDCQGSGGAKPSNLLPWEQLDEEHREVDRRIGEAVARFVRDRDQAGAAPAGLDPLDILDGHRELLDDLRTRMDEIEAADPLEARLTKIEADLHALKLRQPEAESMESRILECIGNGGVFVDKQQWVEFRELRDARLKKLEAELHDGFGRLTARVEQLQAAVAPPQPDVEVGTFTANDMATMGLSPEAIAYELGLPEPTS